MRQLSSPNIKLFLIRFYIHLTFIKLPIIASRIITMCTIMILTIKFHTLHPTLARAMDF